MAYRTGRRQRRPYCTTILHRSGSILRSMNGTPLEPDGDLSKKRRKKFPDLPRGPKPLELAKGEPARLGKKVKTGFGPSSLSKPTRRHRP
jgi:hypothetical protein